ncbi:hypothetical protein SDC9_173566 [bioreactor metagenome]|uniref:Uncharacterized protein n=1 Tax=bioreactor metagenome TaxID=1076179 RepID=A0A645GJU0_9ZZZZ
MIKKQQLAAHPASICGSWADRGTGSIDTSTTANGAAWALAVIRLSAWRPRANWCGLRKSPEPRAQTPFPCASRPAKPRVWPMRNCSPLKRLAKPLSQSTKPPGRTSSTSNSGATRSPPMPIRTSASSTSQTLSNHTSCAPSPRSGRKRPKPLHACAAALNRFLIGPPLTGIALVPTPHVGVASYSTSWPTRTRWLPSNTMPPSPTSSCPPPTSRLPPSKGSPPAHCAF